MAEQRREYNAIDFLSVGVRESVSLSVEYTENVLNSLSTKSSFLFRRKKTGREAPFHKRSAPRVSRAQHLYRHSSPLPPPFGRRFYSFSAAPIQRAKLVNSARRAGGRKRRYRLRGNL